MGSIMAKLADGQAATEDEVVVLDGTQTEEGGVGAVVDGQTGEVDGQTQGAAEADDVVVTIGEEAPPTEEDTPAPEWVRELRKNHRELVRENRELKEKLTTSTAETKPAALGQKPKLEDYDYDTEKFEQDLAKWYDRKRAHDDAAAQAEAAQQEQTKAWQAKLDAYGVAKAALKVKDYDDAEAVAQESLSTTQQGIVLQGAENPALVVYALGKNPKKAKELSAITDPVKFAFAVAKLETQLKVTNRKAAPPPERTVQGTGRVAGAVDSTLERLRAEAEKTGDFTKVTAYKRQKRQAA